MALQHSDATSDRSDGVGGPGNGQAANDTSCHFWINLLPRLLALRRRLFPQLPPRNPWTNNAMFNCALFRIGNMYEGHAKSNESGFFISNWNNL